MTLVGPIAMFASLLIAAWWCDRVAPVDHEALEREQLLLIERRPGEPVTAQDFERLEDEEDRWVWEQAQLDREREQGSDSWAHGGSRQHAHGPR